MKPYDFRWTKFYEANPDFYVVYPHILLDLSNNELIICSTIIDKDNYSVLTTRKMITNQEGTLKSGDMKTAADKWYGDFKEHKKDLIMFGQIQLEDGLDLKYFIEIGKASMIMIHGVRTLIKIQTW